MRYTPSLSSIEGVVREEIHSRLSTVYNVDNVIQNGSQSLKKWKNEHDD